jgi:hypothetical protein
MTLDNQKSFCLGNKHNKRSLAGIRYLSAAGRPAPKRGIVCQPQARGRAVRQWIGIAARLETSYALASQTEPRPAAGVLFGFSRDRIS